MRRRKCRLWWPTHLSSTKPPESSTFLFGWFISSCPSDSLDIVVAFACDEASLSSSQSAIQGILRQTNGNMSVFLQDKCVFSMLGYCEADSSGNGQFPKVLMQEDDQINSIHGDLSHWRCQDMSEVKQRQLRCGCHKLDGSLEQCRLDSVETNNWIQLEYGSYGCIGRKIEWLPKLHHIHWNRQMVSHFDVHVIIYETPTFGGHHFSLSYLNASDKVKTPLKKPKWVEDLQQKEPLLDLDTVILAINSATAAKLSFEGQVQPKKSTFWFRIVCMFVTIAWQLLAVSLASYSTLFYIILQFIHFLLSYGTQSSIYIISAKLFSNTWENIQIRCCQVLYWPICLQDNGFRSRSCVAFAEKAALQKHSMWSSVAIDVLLGNLFGMVLLFHAESAFLWVSDFANDITNSWMRTGCVWLMGIPAGFKLNTELAGVLGMLSLNAIQIWSTLWFFVGFFFIYFIKGLAISGILFGLTTPAALIKDMISLATVHVSTLHLLNSLLYSRQLQAISALWRLFRGRKWNPLRQRLDSYDYNVDQHIVGSLLFTPLLLLIPTTSAFYIFFTIMNTTISFICIFIEATISLIHATPYIKIFLWLVRPRRFPCGIWFEIISRHSNASGSSEIGRVNKIGSPCESLHRRRSRSSVLVSFLHSNFMNIGQIVWPHYRSVYSTASRLFVAPSAFGVLSGRSIPSALGIALPAKMPWMFIPYKEYWRLCHDAVFACKAGHAFYL